MGMWVPTVTISNEQDSMIIVTLQSEKLIPTVIKFRSVGFSLQRVLSKVPKVSKNRTPLSRLVLYYCVAVISSTSFLILVSRKLTHKMP